jgi:hypothetical protein
VHSVGCRWLPEGAQPEAGGRRPTGWVPQGHSSQAVPSAAMSAEPRHPVEQVSWLRGGKLLHTHASLTSITAAVHDTPRQRDIPIRECTAGFCRLFLSCQCPLIRPRQRLHTCYCHNFP